MRWWIMPHDAKQGGLSLVELVLTLAILGLVAAVALPTFDTGPDVQTTRALDEVHSAFLFARSRARASGKRYGVFMDTSDNTLRVFRIDPDDKLVFDVRDPISKQLYAVPFGVGALASVRELVLESTWNDNCRRANYAVFDPAGFVRCLDPLTTEAVEIFAGVRTDGGRQGIQIDGATGRVTR